MAIVERSSQYLSDLDDIWFYIAQDSPTNADRFIDRIKDTVKRIAETSLMGRSAEALSPGLRQFPIGNYLFFYQPLPEGIRAVRIISGYRDIEHLFSDE